MHTAVLSKTKKIFPENEKLQNLYSQLQIRAHTNLSM